MAISLHHTLKQCLCGLALASGIAYASEGPGSTVPQSVEAQLLQAARGEPVEVEAYVFRSLRQHGHRLSPSLTAETIQHLRERAPSATSWLPYYLAVGNIGPGYAGAAGLFALHVSGIEILLDTLGDADKPAAIEASIDNMPRTGGNNPTCTFPIQTSSRPLYEYVSAKEATLYREPDHRLRLLSRLAADTNSTGDLAGLAELVAAMKFRNPADLASATAVIVQLMERIPASSCGTGVLTDQFALPRWISLLADRLTATGQSPASLITAYRDFALRLLKAPICTDDAVESAARRGLAASVKQQIESRQMEGVRAITDKEIEHWEAERKVLSQKAPSFDIPAEILQAYLALLKQYRGPAAGGLSAFDAKAKLDDLLDRWRQWTPSGDGTDFRTSDAKITLLATLCNVNDAGVCEKVLPALVSHLSGSPLKRENPAVWLSYVDMLTSMIHRSSKAAGSRSNPAEKLLAEAADPAISLIAIASTPAID